MLGRLTTLEEIRADNNALSDLPETFRDLRKLRSVKAAAQTGTCTAPPNPLCTPCSQLSLGNNHLAQRPLVLDKLDLTDLRLEGNEV